MTAKVNVLIAADGFTIATEECQYAFSHYMDEDDYEDLLKALDHITADDIEIVLEESY